MPFTPLHIGPGIAVKSVMPRYFSIITFGLTQIMIDIEVLVYILQGKTVYLLVRKGLRGKF
jgi:hypothetical protein